MRSRVRKLHLQFRTSFRQLFLRHSSLPSRTVVELIARKRPTFVSESQGTVQLGISAERFRLGKRVVRIFARYVAVVRSSARIREYLAQKWISRSPMTANRYCRASMRRVERIILSAPIGKLLSRKRGNRGEGERFRSDVASMSDAISAFRCRGNADYRSLAVFARPQLESNYGTNEALVHDTAAPPRIRRMSTGV